MSNDYTKRAAKNNGADQPAHAQAVMRFCCSPTVVTVFLMLRLKEYNTHAQKTAVCGVQSYVIKESNMI